MREGSPGHGRLLAASRGTAKVIDNDGWLHTGDMAKMDDGGFFHHRRPQKDMILVSGFNVYPNEIEDVDRRHARSAGSRRGRRAGRKSGEAVKVVIVKKDASLTAEKVKAYCRENLTGYKLPKYVEFRSELPKSNVVQDPASRAARLAEKRRLIRKICCAGSRTVSESQVLDSNGPVAQGCHPQGCMSPPLIFGVLP